MNEMMKGHFPLFLIEKLFPQMYECSTIKDFKDGMETIKPTKKIIPLGVLLYNAAIISFSSLKYESKKGNIVTLSDITGELEAMVEPGLEKCGILKRGVTLYNPAMCFWPKDRRIILSNYTLHGPEDFDFSENLGYSFA